MTADGSDIMARGGECREAGRWCQQAFYERFRDDGEDGTTGPAHVSPRRVDDDRTKSASPPTGIKDILARFVLGDELLHDLSTGKH
jgi:hypothetical protein